jgi:CheY-like chemotaxis protein
VAHRLVDQHGGTLTAESEGVGKGSRFTVQLPRADAPALAAEPLEHPPAPMRRAAASRRVLLVDDNEDSNEMMREYLEGFGHDVRVAHDGQSGLELAREFAPDIALLDLGLPGMDGFELARRLRLTPQGATIPLVAVSGYARDVDRQKAMKAGFSEHFAKPIELSRLEDLLERAGR